MKGEWLKSANFKRKNAVFSLKMLNSNTNSTTNSFSTISSTNLFMFSKKLFGIVAGLMCLVASFGAYG